MAPVSNEAIKVAPGQRSAQGPDVAVGAPSARLSLRGLHLCRAHFCFAWQGHRRPRRGT